MRRGEGCKTKCKTNLVPMGHGAPIKLKVAKGVNMGTRLASRCSNIIKYIVGGSDKPSKENVTEKGGTQKNASGEIGKNVWSIPRKGLKQSLLQEGKKTTLN